MSPSKLTWHFQAVPAWAGSVVNAEWVKVMDPPAANIFPAQKTIGRVFIPDNEGNDMIMRGAAGADAWFARCQPAYARSPWVWCWEGPNEPPVATPEHRAALVAFTRRWVQIMHSQNPPLRTVALCLGVGWPDIGRASELGGALEATDYWAVHEYGAPTLQSDQSWLCLRYRRTVAELRGAGVRIPPLLITETGIDGGVINRPGAGWKTFADRAGYLNQLTWYDGELRKDSYVQAATIFTSGPNWNWMDFDVDELLSRDLAAYIRQQSGTLPPPPPPPPPPPSPEPPPPTTADFRLSRPLPDGIGYVVQWFGEDADDCSEAGLAGHNGMDYGAPAGTPVLAAHEGRCSVGQDAGYGIFVRITAPEDAYITLYAHLQDVSVSEGQQVAAGATVGHVGNSGKAAAAGLHFGWRIAGVRNPAYGDWVDPYLGRRLNGDA